METTVATMKCISDVAVAVDQSFAASLLLPPLPANLQEHDRPHIMTRSLEPSLIDHLSIHMFHDESLDEYATRVFDYISTLLRDIRGLREGINYCINYRMIATLNYALSELVDDPAVLNVPNQLSPLYTAIHTANVPAVTLLLEKGVATNVPRFTSDRQWSPIRDDWSSLMLASYNDFDVSKMSRRNEIAMLLIRHGCDINHQSEKSTASIYQNALTISAYHHNWPLVSYFLEHCDDEIKEGALQIYRKYPNAMRSGLSSERRVNWNEIRYRRIIGRISAGYDALYEDASIKREVIRKVIEFLGYGIQEMVSVWE